MTPKRDEPRPEGDEWVEWGGELIWAAGFTSGGAPYGLSLEEYRQVSMEREHGAGSARAKRVLQYVFQPDGPGGARIDIGRVKHLGGGLDRDAYVADIEVSDASEQSGTYVVLLPKKGVKADYDACARAEATLLNRLARCELSLRLPRVAAVFPEAGRPALVETYVPGVPLDLRAGRQSRVRPWQVVGEVAAAIHALQPDDRGGETTRREDAEGSLSAFDGLDHPVLVDAKQWATENLPPATPSSFLHGDLLGQNIILSPDVPYGVIDWERAIWGDPAYELAIVTRGVRRPFQIADGLARLLDAYHRAGGVELSAADIHLHELCLAALWYRDSLDAETRVHPPQHCLNVVRGILRRATAVPR